MIFLFSSFVIGVTGIFYFWIRYTLDETIFSEQSPREKELSCIFAVTFLFNREKCMYNDRKDVLVLT